METSLTLSALAGAFFPNLIDTPPLRMYDVPFESY